MSLRCSKSDICEEEEAKLVRVIKRTSDSLLSPVVMLGAEVVSVSSEFDICALTDPNKAAGDFVDSV